MSEHPRFGTMPPLGHDVAVAPVTLDDIGEVRALQRACFTSMQARHSNEAETIAFHSLLASGSYSAELAVSVKRQNLLGAYLDGRLVGSATWTTSREDKRAGRIRFLFVSPLFNGCGIGRRLLTEM
ncbi:MAG: GNAT family N-acetyltransferase, partial [Hyphomicrobiaceae bacterium]